MRNFSSRAAVLLSVACLPAKSFASGVLDPSDFPDPNSLLTPSIVSAVVKSIGLATDHRAYEPATNLGTQLGLDIGIEATLSKLPPDFNAALIEAGSSGANVPFLPVPRLNLHKGMGNFADIGVSAIWYAGYKIIGYELKIPVFRPEEGPNWAFRLSYTNCYLKVPSDVVLELSTKTFTPQLLISRPLEWAEPYLGVGYQYATGTLSLTVDLPEPLADQVSSATGRGSGFQAFTGVGMKIPHLGFKLTLEGSYSTAGASTLGTKFGFSF